MTTPHTSGTITLTQNSAAIAGTLTGWQTAGIQGGIIYPEAQGGNPLPLLSVTSDVAATAAVKWKGASGTYPYALVKDTAYLKTVDAIHTKLLEVVTDLDTPSIGALAAITSTLGAGKVPRGLSANTMEWFTVSDFIKALLDKTDGAGARNAIGAQATLGFTPVQQGTGFGQGGNLVKMGLSNDGNVRLKATVDTTDFGTVWTDYNAARSIPGGYQKLPSGLIIQWGRFIAETALDMAVNFPIAFNTIAGVLVNHVSAGLPSTSAVSSWVGSLNSTGFTATTRVLGNGGSVGGPAGQQLSWIALGY